MLSAKVDNAEKKMKMWAKKNSLDDYESVHMDFSEVLDFINAKFIREHAHKDYELNMSAGQAHPKYYIEDGVERYSVNDWRTHDAQTVQEVFRSNSNFRYGNAIKQWRIGQHKHHYDREAHAAGLKDTRELNTIQRGYNMDDIYGPNKYESSDSIMYGY
jgi:hypothetical protein